MLRFSNTRQERVYERLHRLVGPGPAAFYRDACQLMEHLEPGLQSASHLVAHLLREIESALRDVLEPLAGRPSNRSYTHRNEVEQVLLALGIAHDEQVAQAWLKVADKESEYSLHRHAHRSSLDPPRPINEDFRQLWSSMGAILETILDKLETRFLEIEKLLDTLLAKQVPSAEDLALLRGHVPNNFVTLSYFFDRLSSPHWAQALNDAGMFDNPPGGVWDEERKGVRFQAWPQSRYLARMASQLPKVVSDIAVAVTASRCDNPRVEHDLAEAALAVPTPLAAKWAIKEAEWIERQDQLYLSTLTLKLGELISHLAKGGGQGIEAALALTGALLEILPDPRTREETAELGTLYFPEPRARCGTWEYEQVLGKNIPDVVKAAGERALALLCDLLERAIDLSRREKDEKQAADYSYVWRPALDHRQSTADNLKSMLVSAVRDAAEDLARANPNAVPTLVQELDKRKWAVFRRLALNLLRKFPDTVLVLIEDRLTSCANYDDPHFKREYSLLLQERFSTLRQESQDKILEWIFRGPGRDRAETWFRFIQKEPTDEDFRRFEDRWRWEKLAPIKDVLPHPWKEKYSQLEKQFGEPKDKEYVSFKTHSWSGPTSPKSAEALRSMRVTEVVKFLEAWEWEGRLEGGSPDGLSRELTAAVLADPCRFGTEAEAFIGLREPTYVRGIIGGLAQAAKQGNPFAWDPVLNLCLRVVQQPREIEGRKEGSFDIDPHWGWARSEVARLLSAGLKQGKAEMPIELRALAWKVLEPITNDPYPTPEDEEKYGGSNMDPATLSINSTRGEAMHTVVRYALWVRRHLEKTGKAEQKTRDSFDHIPEVRHILDLHLDPEKDPSLAVRAVYGQWFPWLVYLDSRWARDNARRIFPQDDESPAMLEAAWETYITFCDVYDEVFEIVKDEYSRAVDRVGQRAENKRFLADPDERLGQHLTMLYGRGKLSLDEANGLLRRFFAAADDKLRARTIEFVGRSLRNTAELRPDMIDRFKQLWAWRLDAMRTADNPQVHFSELSAFGWWFISGKFDDEWAMENLLESLRLVQKTEFEDRVVERLVALAEKMPGEAVECLTHLIEGDKEGWAIYAWREHARSILSMALRIGNGEVKQAATDVVNRLGARGYFEFGDLLTG